MDENRGLSRRSLVRAGAHTAWVVPAIQVVGSAPTYAASGSQTLSLATAYARYLNHTDPNTARPDRLEASFTITNTGSVEASSGVSVQVVVPGTSYASAPTVLSSSLPVTSVIPGPGGYAVLLSTPAPLAAGAALPVTLTLQFTDDLDASPYRRWAGLPMTVPVTVTAPGFQSASAQWSIGSTPWTFVSFHKLSASRTGNVVNLAGELVNGGRRTTPGGLTLEVGLYRYAAQPADSFWHTPPTTTTAVATGWTGGALVSQASYWLYTFTSDVPLAPAQSGAANASSARAFSTTFELGPGVEASTNSVYLSVTAKAATANSGGSPVLV